MLIHYRAIDERTYEMVMRDVRIKQTHDLETWATEMKRASDALLAERNNERWSCLINLEGFELDPALASAYGARAKSFVSAYFDACIRFGDPEGVCSKTALRLGALSGRFPSNIYTDREAAMVALSLMSPSSAASAS